MIFSIMQMILLLFLFVSGGDVNSNHKCTNYTKWKNATQSYNVSERNVHQFTSWPITEGFE